MFTPWRSCARLTWWRRSRWRVVCGKLVDSLLGGGGVTTHGRLCWPQFVFSLSTALWLCMRAVSLSIVQLCLCVFWKCVCVFTALFVCVVKVCVFLCVLYSCVCVYFKRVCVCLCIFNCVCLCFKSVCVCVFTTVFPWIVKVCVCFSVYCTTVFVWMWVSVSALLVQVFSLSSGERGTKKVLEWKKESSTALIATVTKYYPGCPREGWEGHPGGGGPPVGGQDVLQLPGPSKPLPHHGVPARRWCFPLSFFLPFSFLSSCSPDVKFLILASDFLSPVKVPEVEWWCRGLAWIKDGSLPL